MTRVITREQTKKLVRGLKKNLVGDKEAFGIRSIVLYGDGKGRFAWLSEFIEEVPYGFENIDVPAALAYEKDGAGNLRRKRLGELDDLFYRAINGSEYAKKKSAIKQFSMGRLRDVSNRLKYSNLFVIDGREGLSLTVTLYRTIDSPTPKNRRFVNANGNDLGRHFIDMLTFGDYNIKNVEEDSESGMMSVSIGEDNLQYWNEFMRAVEDFDKMLDTEG